MKLKAEEKDLMMELDYSESAKKLMKLKVLAKMQETLKSHKLPNNYLGLTTTEQNEVEDYKFLKQNNLA